MASRTQGARPGQEGCSSVRDDGAREAVAAVAVAAVVAASHQAGPGKWSCPSSCPCLSLCFLYEATCNASCLGSPYSRPLGPFPDLCDQIPSALPSAARSQAVVKDTNTRNGRTEHVLTAYGKQKIR